MKRFLRMGEAEEYAGLNRKTIRNMILNGIFDGDTTAGGHWRVDRESIDEYFSRSRTSEKAIAILRGL